MFDLSDYIGRAGLAPEDASVVLHTPRQPALSAEDRLLLEPYQSYHNQAATATSRWRDHMISFVGLLDPDMDAGELIAIENNWKMRLHTLEFGLNVN